MSSYAHDAVWDVSTVGLGVFHGRAAIREFMEDWFRSYDQIEPHLEQVTEVGEGVTFTVTSQKAQLAGSGGDAIAIRYALVVVWVDGLMASVTNYRDIDEARAAAERLAEERG